MMLISFYRAAKFAVHNMWRNLWLSLATVFIIILTLFSITLLASVNLVASETIASIKEKVDISVFFKPEALDQELSEVQDTIAKLPEVRSIEYISKDEALSSFKEKNKSNPTIQETLSILGSNPLGASIQIKANSLSDFPAIIQALQNQNWQNIIQETDYRDNQLLITRLTSITEKVKNVGLIITLTFIVIAILIIFNTIRINIYTQREELGIMRLVGATNSFIRAPFLIEGIIYATLGSIITLAIFYPLLKMSAGQVNNFFEGYNFDVLAYFYAHFWQIFALLLIISFLLSIFSSMAAMGRHLKV